MKKIIPICYLLLTLAGLVCAILCAVQFAMAIRFLELGRVIVYFLLAVICAGVFGIGLTRLIRMRNRKESGEKLDK